MNREKYYAGIGSRETPKEVLKHMSKIATQLERKGYTLRSGGADGADLAFEQGVKTRKEIYLPWKGFNDSKSLNYNISEKAMLLTAKFHQAWDYLPPAVKKLMARNAYQVLGESLNEHSEFIVCWTKDGVELDKDRTSKTGGTGQAISIASNKGIRVYNIQNKKSLLQLKLKIRGL